MKIINGERGAIVLMASKDFNDIFHHTGMMPHCDAQWFEDAGIVIIPWEKFEMLIGHLSVDEALKLFKDYAQAGVIQDHWMYGPNKGRVYSEIALKKVIAGALFIELEEQP